MSETETKTAEEKKEAGAPETAAAAAYEPDAMSELQADVEKFRDLAMRAHADLDNYRKRAAREKEEAIQYANTRLLERLLPVIDHFELGLAEARKAGEHSALLSGMEMVFKQLNDFLAEMNVQPIEAVGQKFDPHIHDALAQEASADVPEGMVIRQMRKGYKLKERLLRPAGVVVSKGKPA